MFKKYQGSGMIRDQGSGIRDRGSGIREIDAAFGRVLVKG
jgi:hypothetical protein